jgi:GTPase SAR1 family protein
MGWERWNLRQNPFEPRPLESAEEIEGLFVGREGELSEIKKVLSSPGVRVAIEADAGAGKTTFVYKIYNELLKERQDVLVAFPTIRLGPYATGAHIKSNAALALASALMSLKKSGKLKRGKRKKLDEIIGQARELKITGLQMGGSFFPPAITVGVGLEHAPKVETLSFLSHSAEDLARMISELLPELGLTTAIVALNSFDVLHEEHLETILQDLRDFVFTRNVSFLLLGGRGFYERTQLLPRWRGVFSAFPIELKPFDEKTMLNIIERRIRFYSLSNKTPISPVTPQLLDYLCELAGDNLRWLLSTLSELGTHFLDMPRIDDRITIDTAEPALKVWALRKLESLSAGPKKILKKMIEYNKETYSADKEFQKFAKCTQPWLHRVLGELEAGGHVIKRYEGKKTLYFVGPDYKILTHAAISKGDLA